MKPPIWHVQLARLIELVVGVSLVDTKSHVAKSSIRIAIVGCFRSICSSKEHLPNESTKAFSQFHLFD